MAQTGATSAGVATDSQGPTPRPRKISSSHKSWSPEIYANAVSAHAGLSVEASLYPGPNFDRLAAYLQSPFEGRRRFHPLSTQSSRVTFAHYYQKLGASSRERLELSQPEDVLPLPHDQPASSGSAGSLMFLRGLPSPEWLANIGGAFCVDPEFFQRHLDFLSTTGRINYYPPVSMPSSSDHIIHLRYMTISKPGSFVQASTAGRVRSLRAAGEREMKSYLTSLTSSLESSEAIGNSIVRGFSLFKNGHVVIEQAISMCVTRSENGWTALAWIDTGKDLSIGPPGPWSKYISSSPQHIDQRVFMPTIQIRPRVALRSQQYSVSPNNRAHPKFAQSAALLHQNYGRTLDRELMGCDPFYAFHELFSFCACSEAQFLNMVESSISEDTTSVAPEDLIVSQSNFMYTQELLQMHIDRLRDNIEVIKVRGSAFWPRARNATQMQMCSTAAETLRRDYEWLYHRATVLAERCSSKTSHLATRAMLAESSKAIDQSREVAKLTRLAFIFVPLSFTSSLFGMNLEPLVDAKFQIWLWVLVSVPVLLLSLVVMQFDVISMVQRAHAKTRKKEALMHR